MYRLTLVSVFAMALCLSPGAVALVGFGDSASGPLDTTLPMFSELEAAPAQARAGDLVTLSFRVSKVLETAPMVLVNGNIATFSNDTKSVLYTYVYEVQNEDALGMAQITITGWDALGNTGTMTDNTSLELLSDLAGLPLRLWPVLAALAAVALITVRGKRRAVAVLLAAALILTPAAFAQGPEVSNVSFTQGPDGAGGTKVDIYYDLFAPNAPCYITVLLSKDGGLNFDYPVTSITGDIHNVETGAGRHITWAVATDYPNEAIFNAVIRVVADDEAVLHTLVYTAGPNGAISGPAEQTVLDGGNGVSVEAVPDEGYHFVQWSDGVTDNPRTDTNVTESIAVEAEFAINSYTLDYTAGANGSIDGDASQLVEHGASGTPVEAVPAPGYHFVQWSDGRTDNPRTEMNVTENSAVEASFAINTYGITLVVVGNGTLNADPEIVEHGATSSISVVPEEGWSLQSLEDSVDGPQAGDYTTSAVTAPRTVTATFAINTYAITLVVNGQGVLGAAPQIVEHGATSDITVGAPSGWTLDSLVDSVDGAQAGNYTTSAVTAPRTVTATFVPITFTVDYAANPIGGGSVSGDGTITHDGTPGDAIVVTVAPLGGWYTVSVSASNGVVTEDAGVYTLSGVTANTTVTALFSDVPPTLTAFDLNGGDATTNRPTVSLDYTATGGPPTHYYLSEAPITAGDVAALAPGDWIPLPPGGVAPEYYLSAGFWTKTVYFVVRNPLGASNIRNDSILYTSSISFLEMIDVPAGAFTMGRVGVAEPVHDVTLDAYRIGKYHITTQQYCEVLNWARSEGRLLNADGTQWTPGEQFIYAGEGTAIYPIHDMVLHDASNISWSGGQFVVRTRSYSGVTYSMADFPATGRISWAGAAAFCNWMTEMRNAAEGGWRTPIYDMSSQGWPRLGDHTDSQYGYRLPTEAEWERAAAWDADTQTAWLYGMSSDTINWSRANYRIGSARLNAFGWGAPEMTPGGWFNGLNIHPRTNISPASLRQTIDGSSPVGCYDMAGSNFDMLEDRGLRDYTADPVANPVVDFNGVDEQHARRGGAYHQEEDTARSANRALTPHIDGCWPTYGFRLALTPEP